MALDVVCVNYHTDHLYDEFVWSFLENYWEGCTLTGIHVQAATIPKSRFIQRHTPWYRSMGVSSNIGYARACNLGASYGKNDVILLANADTLLTSGLRECYDALLSEDKWGVLGPRQVDLGGRFTAGGIFGTETNISQRGWQHNDVGQYNAVEEAMSVSGSLYFIKRHVWEEMTNCPFMQAAYPGIEGAFIPTPHYYEETCCSYHVRHHGYKVIFYGPVQMIHHWHKASEIGGYAEQSVETSKGMMREFLHGHGITCE